MSGTADAVHLAMPVPEDEMHPNPGAESPDVNADDPEYDEAALGRDDGIEEGVRRKDQEHAGGVGRERK